MKKEEIYEYVQKQYGTMPEYLWSKLPVPEFVNMRLRYDKMAECLSHVKSCPSCRDELEIYFIVERGIKDNEAFDGPFVLKDIVNECFARAQHRIIRGRRHKRIIEAFKFFIYLVIFIGVVMLVTYLL